MIKVNEALVRPTMFPDGTSQVWKLPESILDNIYRDNECVIEWRFENEAELIHIAQLKTLIDTYCDCVNLSMPYLPYGRQDKRVDNQSTFALRTFAKLINTMNFNEVRVIDAHNNSRAHMIDRLEDRDPRPYIFNAIGSTKATHVLFPDFGARGRYEAYMEDRKKVRVMHATKDRDPKTGYIKNVQIAGGIGKLHRATILIVDDICDGGMTFKLVAEAVSKLKGVKDIHLYVTHGIFSKGLETLRNSGIKRIFTHKGELGKISNAALKAELLR